MSFVPVMRQPCTHCPWRKDVSTELWGPHRFHNLRGCVGAPTKAGTLKGIMMLCHKSPGGEQLPEVIGEKRLSELTACAGWLLVEGRESLGARLLSVWNGHDVCLDVSAPEGIQLYTSFAEMAEANGAVFADEDLPSCQHNVENV